jgi:hypothetical protein
MEGICNVVCEFMETLQLTFWKIPLQSKFELLDERRKNTYLKEFNVYVIS